MQTENQGQPVGLPLAGVRVLDLSRILAGPWSAMVLGDLGAEVIKVEHPDRGDDTRDWGVRIGQTETAYFNSVNRNKRSITLDLQTPEGQQIARDLARTCDVVVQNFKFGGAEKLGLGYEQLSAENPRLIYCSISGYDRTGPEAKRPGYDLVVQGEAGLMALNGEASQPPLKFGVAAVDLFTGMYSAQAMLAALFQRERSGRGRHIEMALFDCGLMITAYYGLEALVMGEDPPRYGNDHPSIVPYGVFDAADGPLVITVGNNSQFERFAREVIERPDLADDARYKTNILRSQNRAALLPELKRELGARARKLLLERLAQAGIPCGEVAGLREALLSPRATEAGLVTQQPHPHTESGTTPVLAPPWRFDGERMPVRRAPPQLGEGTRELLGATLGYTDEQLEQLKEKGVI
ncbi:crotonobetainyl-CoA:carnitine CoA-transferase CaiB-like acyl-CoA transferase [Paraburkholderia bannensis]|uniref:Crotonobetainyl-CoA:carnitine CoA-transferase CaiB-like acyl-CoA transferase n=1 Tax=Paraburkholderia bannensis TaxID=765414 RepID=A0A7W9TV76_9BURK|nr:MULTISPECIES: CaiB/BaiF CoA-transferase family protein [Paraburkholderia]MBB3257093.1 crotonobetainyl-CoA:carnitine CoA-transferase CaiB-like acyl-CoA transferase [Paraburkholderia sp. WP4_3_2]MBB6102047.1 crotonobetainyl-CoA:carnitine CoA-transferase CaiB-like acyl-CoA transferase [Paraburkholderia bannensis]